MPLLCRVPRLPPTRNLNWIALHSSAELLIELFALYPNDRVKMLAFRSAFIGR